MREEKSPDSQRMHLVFGLIHGFIDTDLQPGVLTKERREIDALTDEIYRHRLTLCTRAGLDFEDRDIEGIIDAYERMNCLVARLMYKQGQLDGAVSAQK